MVPPVRLPARASLRVCLLAVVLSTVPLAGHGSAEASAAARKGAPVAGYQLPFICGQSWTGSTRARHSPSPHAVDFNRSADEGKPVVAAAPGVVVTAVPDGRSGYGRYVAVDHGNGESTLYAHLKNVLVSVGASVDQGTLLGSVGSTGNSSGPHLHFEEKLGRQVVPAYFGRLPFVPGTAVSANCADVPLAADLDGAPGAEAVVFRRTRKGSFLVHQQGAAPRAVRFGAGTDEPLLGDWDGDGVAEPGVWSPRGRMFKLSTPAGVVSRRFGVRGDRPVVGDWDGDRVWDLGVYRPSTGTFLLRSATGAVTTITLGRAGDVPVVGDWNGDGRTDVGVHDRATSTFVLRHPDAAGTPVLASVQFGTPGDLPVVGDWDGDGTTELGTWTPATALLNQRRTDAGGAARAVSTVQVGRPR